MASYNGRDIGFSTSLEGSVSPSDAAPLSVWASKTGTVDDTAARDTATSGGGGVSYLMRGYYVAGSVFEYFYSSSQATTNPPSGHTLTNVVVIGVNKT